MTNDKPDLTLNPAAPHPGGSIERHTAGRKPKTENRKPKTDMYINITSLLELDCFDLSHSRAEGGENAGQNTWNASKAQANKTPLLDTEEKLEAMREFARSSGGWTREEIAAWNAEEINALFLQWVAGDVREAGADSLDGIDWEEYEKMATEGRVSSNLSRGDDGQISFYLGS
jgi:hypothetical protein